MEVLTVNVTLTGSYWVEGPDVRAGMLTFTGDARGPLFRGRILPGGVDTQTIRPGALTMSARYMLEGTDADGRPCRVFIENNAAAQAVGQPLRTAPRIVTDSPRLQWLQEAPLFGTLEPNGENAVRIHIFTEDD